MNDSNDKTLNLARAFLSLADADECLAFFGDLFTVREIEDLSSRLEVARMLAAGVNYVDIAAATGASTATISRVSKCLSGERGGYRTVLERAEGGGSANLISLESLSDEEAAAVRTIVASMKK
jgi:TrpR-related protein YerC/YecD